VQPYQFGTAGVAMLLQPVSQHEPGDRVWVGDDAVEDGVQRAHDLAPSGQSSRLKRTRQPKLAMREPGPSLLRWAERQCVGSLIHEPPRSTRAVPFVPFLG
jgi:hypothetical protein